MFSYATEHGPMKHDGFDLDVTTWTEAITLTKPKHKSGIAVVNKMKQRNLPNVASPFTVDVNWNPGSISVDVHIVIPKWLSLGYSGELASGVFIISSSSDGEMDGGYKPDFSIDVSPWLQNVIVDPLITQITPAFSGGWHTSLSLHGQVKKLLTVPSIHLTYTSKVLDRAIGEECRHWFCLQFRLEAERELMAFQPTALDTVLQPEDSTTSEESDFELV